MMMAESDRQVRVFGDKNFVELKYVLNVLFSQIDINYSNNFFISINETAKIIHGLNGEVILEPSLVGTSFKSHVTWTIFKYDNSKNENNTSPEVYASSENAIEATTLFIQCIVTSLINRGVREIQKKMQSVSPL